MEPWASSCCRCSFCHSSAYPPTPAIAVAPAPRLLEDESSGATHPRTAERNWCLNEVVNCFWCGTCFTALVVTGDSFGENALSGDGRRNATIGCITDLEMLVLSKDKFQAIMADLVHRIGRLWYQRDNEGGEKDVVEDSEVE